ncbi:MAG: hypothetical protein ACYTF1_15575 [Planctomycetota bacterium]|jgi:hypothetical protein
MIHDWRMDLKRSRHSINVLIWRCSKCGCLQIKKGGMSAPSVYKPNDPSWSPFETMETEPDCLLSDKIMPLQKNNLSKKTKPVQTV